MLEMYLAYCDDEPIQLEYTKRIAEKWAAEAGVLLEFTGYHSGEEVLFENTEGYPFDLLILDIDMQGMDGMTLAEKIRRKDERLPIVFLTNLEEYVFQGYELHALRYLLKPLNEEKLFPLLDEINGSKSRQKRYLIENVRGDLVKIELGDIIYIEALGHYLKIHTRQRDYELKKSLSDISTELMEAQGVSGAAGFVSTHRSFLVNLFHVERLLRTDCILSDGSAVPVSRNAYKSVNEAFIAYYRI